MEEFCLLGSRSIACTQCTDDLARRLGGTSDQTQGTVCRLMRYVRSSTHELNASIIAEAGRRAGLDRQEPSVFVTLHILRHTWFYMLRQKGISAEIRAELAGHSLETTMKYGKPKRPEIERAITALDDAATV